VGGAAAVAACLGASVRGLRETLREERRVILAVLTASVCAAGGYLIVTPPVYRATALLQLETGAGGQRVEARSAPLGPRTHEGGEITIVPSRLPVGTALDQPGLDVQIRPRWFPGVGQALARHRRGDSPANPPLGLRLLEPYAWGGERLSFRSLQVPKPLVGRPLLLTALGDDRFRLSGEGGVVLAEGRVGSLASAGTGDARVEALVTELSARPGTVFELRKRSRLELIDSALAQVVVSERGEGTGLISVAYESGSPAAAAALVSSVCFAYLQPDFEVRQAEAMGAFLGRLPTQLGADRDSAELYLMLARRARALQVVHAASPGTVRMVAWPTTPNRPVRPLPGPALALGALLGLVGGVAAALGRRVLAGGAEDARHIEESTGLRVHVTIPYSPREVSLRRSAGRRARVPLVLAAPDDAASEVLRALGATLRSVLEARGKIVAVSSPSSGAGKSFVCANLAHLVATAGRRVLLVDADLRDGLLHRYFTAEQSPGLSDVLGGGAATLDEAIQGTGTARLEILPRGGPVQSPAELLAQPRLEELLAAAAARYDLVLVDTPPVLSVDDALLVARSASVNLLVLRPRRRARSDIAEALERFSRSGLVVHGGILNGARPGKARAQAVSRRLASPEMTPAEP
jgi:capsular exopolysaccharide synthesis family protein